jgi:hypothetical protein
MYRHVHIQYLGQLESLDQRSSELFKARGIDVWRWVWTLQIYLKDPSPQDSEKMVTLFSRIVNVTKVHIVHQISSPELLATLRHCCPLLRSLEIAVIPDSHETMAQVGLFEHLKHLDIRTMRLRRSSSPWQLPMGPLTDVPSWNMLAVTRFHWQHPAKFRDKVECTHLAAFMSRCRFPRLTHLHVDLIGYTRLEEISYVCRLLDAHRHIKSFTINMSEDLLLSISPFVRAPTFRIWCAQCPPRAFVPFLRPEVKTLELELSCPTFHDDEEPVLRPALTTSLWELLTQFASEDGPLPTLETIRVSATDTDGKPTPTAEEGFLCTLRSHVLPLNAQGIRVFVDDDEIRT